MYSVIIDDITKFKCDVIFNSVGVIGKNYGKLCESIITAADDINVKNAVDVRGKSTFCSNYFTGAGKLPCKKICHIVTPFKKGDGELTELKKAYTKAIDICLKAGFKKMGIPFIGTGANGYSEEEVFRVLQEILDEYTFKEENQDDIIIDATIIKKLNSKHSMFEEGRVAPNGESFLYYRQVLRTLGQKVKNIQYESDLVFYCAKQMSEIDYNKCFLKENEYITHPVEYIERYRDFKNFDNKVFSKNVFGRKRKYQLKKQKSIKKGILFVASFVLGMSKTETIELMVLNGSSFNPFDTIDLFYLCYLNGMCIKANDIYELDELYSKFLEENHLYDDRKWMYLTSMV